jgi:zinc protease
MFLDEKTAETLAKDAARTTGYGVSFAGMAQLSGGMRAARFRLANGLTLLILPDAQAPIFAYQTWFNVGSRHEPKGKTGIAHLFEHLMFKGTKNHPLGEFDHEMEKRGAQTNAATWMDWTFYRQALASHGDNFETVIAYESDRMVNLALTQEMVDSEREVVKNERRQRVDDSIHGSLDELMYQTAYIAHSYGHPTIGYMEDLDKMNLKEFEAFYKAYYAPNNATIVIVGDLDPARMVTQVVKAYGALHAQPLPEPPKVVEPKQESVRRAQIYKPTDTERASIVYHGPAQSHPDHAALQVACEILCGGETGRLYSELVIEKELCQEAHASITPYKEPGLFQIDIGMKPGLAFAEAEAITLQHIATLGAEGPTAKEVEKTKNRIEAAYLRVLLDADGRAEQIGHFETTAGDATFMSTVLERLRQVDEAAVKRAVTTYLNPNARTVACALPEEQRRA